MRLRSWGALGAFAVLAALMLSVSASGADTSTATQTYVVQMLESPVVAYEGGTAGLAATKPAKGQKIDPNSAAVKKYAAYLVAQHDAALQKVGGAAKLYDYAYTYNGFAAKLTAAEDSAREAGRRARGVSGGDGHGGHVVDACLPRADRAGRALGSAWRPHRRQERRRRRRERRHRRRRLGHLAREQELLRPRRGRQAQLPADSEGTGSARRARASTPRCATRS